jgi:hypothetical protein
MTRKIIHSRSLSNSGSSRFHPKFHTVSKKATFGLSNLSNSVLMTNLASIVAALNACDD